MQGTDLAMLGAFTAGFSALFVASRLSLWGSVRPADKQWLLASCNTALCHALVVSAWAARLLQRWDFQFDGPNGPSDKALLLFSGGYFLADTLAYLLPAERRFGGQRVWLLHHAVTLAFLGSALALHRGSLPIALGLLAGEVTNPLYHVFLVLEQLSTTSKAAKAVFPVWSAVFTSCFILVRCILGPPTAVWFTWRTIHSPGLPAAVKALWIAVAWGITAVSQLFGVDFVRRTRQIWRQRLPAVPGGTHASDGIKAD